MAVVNLKKNESLSQLKISIIGLGLIGSSIARALTEKVGIRDITALNDSMGPIIEAKAEGYIARGYIEPNNHIYESDVIFLCTPVKLVSQYIDTLSEKAAGDTIITDVGSTKKSILEHIVTMKNPPCFIGGHPMAGSEKSGHANGSAHLFENAYYIITPSVSSSEYSLNLIKKLVKGMGAIPVSLRPSEHDKIMAAISHVPHVIASALVNMVFGEDMKDKMQTLAAGGFKDITRIASSSPAMWESIVLNNKNEVAGFLKHYIDIIENFIEAINVSGSKEVFDFFEKAKKSRNSIKDTDKGLIEPIYSITVDVQDKPGIIGRIASILGNKGINIKNINVSHSREFEQGCLKITLPDYKSCEKSADLLSEHGYKVYLPG